MSKLKVGLIGIGDISNKYIENLKLFPEDVELYGCACTSLEKAQRVAKEFGFVKAYASGDDLIADSKIDIVINLTIPAFHYEYNIKALKAGKHVYTEKPLAGTFEEGKEIMALAKEKGLYVGCAPDTFMGARIQTMKRLIDEGVTGDIIGGCANMVSHGWEWFHPNVAFYYQPGGGPALDMGPYYMTALAALLGPVEKVVAFGSQPLKSRKFYNHLTDVTEVPVHPDVMTHFSGLLYFKNGAIITITLSWDVWDSALPRIELYGMDATLCISEDDPNAGPNVFGGDVLIRDSENYRWRLMPPSKEDMALPWKVAENKHDYDAVSYTKNNRGIGIVDMIRAINEKRPNRANGDMALHVLEVLYGIVVSAKENRTVYMETDFEIPAPMPQKK